MATCQLLAPFSPEEGSKGLALYRSALPAHPPVSPTLSVAWIGVRQRTLETDSVCVASEQPNVGEATPYFYHRGAVGCRIAASVRVASTFAFRQSAWTHLNTHRLSRERILQRTSPAAVTLLTTSQSSTTSSTSSTTCLLHRIAMQNGTRTLAERYARNAYSFYLCAAVDNR